MSFFCISHPSSDATQCSLLPLACDIDGDSRFKQCGITTYCVLARMLAMPDKVDQPVISLSSFALSSRLGAAGPACRAKDDHNGFFSLPGPSGHGGVGNRVNPLAPAVNWLGTAIHPWTAARSHPQLWDPTG